MWANSFREILPHWELADSFTAIEAAALIAGVEPTSLDESLEWFRDKQSGLTVSDGIQEFTASLGILLGAIRSGKLKADSGTGHLKEISVDRDDLVEWMLSKSKRFRPAFFFPDEQGSGESTSDAARQHLRQLEAENARLSDQVAELQQQLQEATAAAQRAPQETGPAPQQAAAAPQDGKKPPSTKELYTLRKLVIGMATAYHGYDPCVKRSSTAASIVSELARLDINIDADTVRKHLKEAAETVLPATIKP